MDLPPGYLARLYQIESGGDPNAVTGSNRGKGQFSPDLERKYGISDPTNPAQQDAAVQREYADLVPGLTRVLGRPPTPGEAYLAHQQGLGGATAHFQYPDQPAWQSMAGTAEGRAKGDKWARDAIWGNIPDRPQDSPNFNKTMFPGGVDSVTSGDFTRGWVGKFEGGVQNPVGSPQAPASPQGILAQAQPQNAPAASPGGLLSQPQANPNQLAGLLANLGQQQLQPSAQMPAPQPIRFPVPPGLAALAHRINPYG